MHVPYRPRVSSYKLNKVKTNIHISLISHRQSSPKVLEKNLSYPIIFPFTDKLYDLCPPPPLQPEQCWDCYDLSQSSGHLKPTLYRDREEVEGVDYAKIAKKMWRGDFFLKTFGEDSGSAIINYTIVNSMA